ncbi:CdaR family transcriptional regulator [Arthrobacter sp. ISL-28]|uniref:PucR family transcriptional regulator n=1 Tax=Arthrobacter sp. ISL-28 TaxID=2819108 RepID=UPI001BEB6927|nr:helix-turn-helix domain-containing protein [Arthrobacter sp. ISL-28]MBT2523018.1 helix-turn-helix domain-containing protein [Arthrobacter sp. ISL-28]
MPLSDHSRFPASKGNVATIKEVLARIGEPIVRVLAAPRGLDHEIRGTFLHDPADPLPEAVDALLLVPGLTPDSAAATELLSASRLRGYCGIVIKQRGVDATDLAAAAVSAGVTVLTADDDVPWRHLDSLLLSLLGSQGAGVGETAAGDDLFALANALAAVVGGAVSIEDLDRKVLAYSSLPDQPIDELRREGILNRRVPEINHNLGRYRVLLEAADVVRFPEELGTQPRSAITMRAGRQPLGSIWAIEPPNGLSADGERALIDGASLAVMHLLRRRNADELEWHMRESAILGALNGSWPAHDIAFRLSLPPNAELILCGLALLPDQTGTGPLMAHLGSAVSRYVFALRPDAGVATTSRAVYVLLPSGGLDAALRLARGALSAMSPTFNHRVRVAVGQATTDAAKLPTIRQEVDDVLRVTLADASLPNVARLSDVHTRVLLNHVGDELTREPRLQHPGIAAMVAYDRRRNTDFAASISAWLEAAGDVSTAASALHIHANTLRYRLRRVSELFGLDLNHPDDRLGIWIQLRHLDRVRATEP